MQAATPRSSTRVGGQACVTVRACESVCVCAHARVHVDVCAHARVCVTSTFVGNFAICSATLRERLRRRKRLRKVRCSAYTILSSANAGLCSAIARLCCASANAGLCCTSANAGLTLLHAAHHFRPHCEAERPTCAQLATATQAKQLRCACSCSRPDWVLTVLMVLMGTEGH